MSQPKRRAYRIASTLPCLALVGSLLLQSGCAKLHKKLHKHQTEPVFGTYPATDVPYAGLASVSPQMAPVAAGPPVIYNPSGQYSPTGTYNPVSQPQPNTYAGSPPASVKPPEAPAAAPSPPVMPPMDQLPPAEAPKPVAVPAETKPAAAAPAAPETQQNKMKTCNAEAKDKDKTTV